MKVGDVVLWKGGRRIGVILQEYWTYDDEESQYEVEVFYEGGDFRKETWYEYDMEARKPSGGVMKIGDLVRHTKKKAWYGVVVAYGKSPNTAIIESATGLSGTWPNPSTYLEVLSEAR